MHDITVSGSGHGIANTNSRLALPIDLSESVEEVRLIHEDADLSNFSKQCLEQGRQVLGSVVYQFLNLFNHGETRMLVTKKMK